jgi:peroxiredoxin
VAAPPTHGLLPDQEKEVIDVEGKPNSTRFVELEERFQELESHIPEGTRAPDFELPDASGKLVRLSDFRGRPVVIAFYPLDWSPTCSDQLSLYQSELQEFEKLGAQVIGISVDSIYSHGAWAAVRGIKFPLLADFNPKGAVAQRYNAWRERDGFSERALYVVDGAGVIRYSHISPELHKIPDIYELFDVLEKISEAREPAAARGGDNR